MTNRIFLAGKIEGSVEIKQVGKKGTTLAKFLLKHGETTYNIVVWGKKAESLDLLNRNNLLLIEGKLEKNVWTNKEGKQLEEYQIVAESIEILS